MEAATELGEMILHGHGFVRKPKDAAKWLKVAADNNFDKALFLLGTLYIDGRS